MRYSNVRDFRTLSYEVLKELTDNLESDRYTKQKGRYDRCIHSLKACIELFEENSSIMEFDMSFLVEFDQAYFRYSENWYRLIYEELQLVSLEIERLLPPANRTGYSVAEFAMALWLKNISITKDGHGHDGTDYLEKFGLPVQTKVGKRPTTLYNKRHEVVSGKIVDQNGRITERAKQIVKDYL
jgi:hypothetical protein